MILKQGVSSRVVQARVTCIKANRAPCPTNFGEKRPFWRLLLLTVSRASALSCLPGLRVGIGLTVLDVASDDRAKLPTMFAMMDEINSAAVFSRLH